MLAQLPQHDRLVEQRSRNGETVNAIVAFEIGDRLIAVVHRPVVFSQTPLDIADIREGVADGAVIESNRTFVDHHRFLEDRERVLVVSREHPGDAEDVETVPDRAIGVAKLGDPDGIGFLEHGPRLEELTQPHVDATDEVLEVSRDEGLTLEGLIDLREAAIEDLVDGLGVAVGPRRVEPAEDPRHQLNHLLRSVCLTFRPDHAEAGSDGAENQHRHDQGGGCHRHPVPTDELSQPIGGARRAGLHRLVVHVALDIRSQFHGRGVAPGPVFLEGLHDDPVEVALEFARKVCRAGPAALGRHIGIAVAVGQPGRGPRRLLFADPAPHFVESGASQSGGVEGLRADEQLVKNDAQRIDIGSGVDIEARHLGLFGTHVLRGADPLTEFGKDGPLGEPSAMSLWQCRNR